LRYCWFYRTFGIFSLERFFYPLEKLRVPSLGFYDFRPLSFGGPFFWFFSKLFKFVACICTYKPTWVELFKQVPVFDCVDGFFPDSRFLDCLIYEGFSSLRFLSIVIPYDPVLSFGAFFLYPLALLRHGSTGACYLHVLGNQPPIFLCGHC